MNAMTFDRLLALEYAAMVDGDGTNRHDRGIKTTMRVTPDRGGPQGPTDLEPRGYPKRSRGFQPGASIASKKLSLSAYVPMARSMVHPVTGATVMCKRDTVLSERPTPRIEAVVVGRKKVLDPFDTYHNGPEIRLVLGKLLRSPKTATGREDQVSDGPVSWLSERPTQTQRLACSRYAAMERERARIWKEEIVPTLYATPPSPEWIVCPWDGSDPTPLLQECATW